VSQKDPGEHKAEDTEKVQLRQGDACRKAQLQCWVVSAEGMADCHGYHFVLDLLHLTHADFRDVTARMNCSR
jgi:hypothetical protein